MATATCNEAKKNPVNCTIETDTTTIEVVTTEALIEHDEDDDTGEQVITMATHSTRSSSDMAADVKMESEITNEEYGRGGEEEEDEEDEGTTTTTMYATVLDAAAAMDAEDLLEAVGLKILRRYSLWDLMLTKARSPDVDGILPLLISDTERVLLELKILLESTMEYVPPRVGRKKKNLNAKELNVTELLGAALCVDPGLWRMKNMDNIHYDSPMLEIHRLLPRNTPAATSEVLGSANVITDVNEPLATVAAAAGSSGPRRRDAYTGKSIGGRSSVNVKEERDLDVDEEVGVKVKNEPGYAVSSSGRRIKRKTGYHVEAAGFGEDPPLSGRRGRPRKRKVVTAAEDSDAEYEGKPFEGAMGKRLLQGNEENEPKSTAKVKKARLKYKMEENKFACQYSDCTKLDVRYKNRSEFEQHFLDDHATDEHKFIPCLVGNCGEMFALTSQRNSHMEENHERYSKLIVTGR